MKNYREQREPGSRSSRKIHIYPPAKKNGHERSLSLLLLLVTSVRGPSIKGPDHVQTQGPDYRLLVTHVSYIPKKSAFLKTCGTRHVQAWHHKFAFSSPYFGFIPPASSIPMSTPGVRFGAFHSRRINEEIAKDARHPQGRRHARSRPKDEVTNQAAPLRAAPPSTLRRHDGLRLHDEE